MTIDRAHADCAYVQSESDGHVFYRVTAESCGCKAFEFRKAPEYRCKHQRAAFPFYCCNCGTDEVAAEGDMCVGCSAVLATNVINSRMVYA